MAFLKYAKAAVVKPVVNSAIWDDVRHAAVTSGNSFNERQAARAFKQFGPDKYMLSHCTIIASVDTDEGPGPLGRQMVDGFQVDRQYSDYFIKPNTSQYINNNKDSWERKLLLSSFNTFIGGENYVEHLQIPEMSKGKIVDAVARDIGDSIYVDILVATDKRHKPLVTAVESQQLSTLSMGCFLGGTQVSLADGVRVPIEEVQPGDMVLTHKGRAREVLNRQERMGSWSVRTIRAVGLPTPITATGTHPFFVIRPAKTCACGCGAALQTQDRDPVRRVCKRFKQGHDKRLFNPNGTYSLEEARQRKQHLADLRSLKPEEVTASELQVGDYLCLPGLAEQGEVVSEGRARLLGYFLAEGSFLKRKGAYCEVQFCFSLDEKDTLAADVVKLLLQEFPEANPAWIQEREDRHTATVHVTGAKVAEWFKYHGGEYSHRKRLSPEASWWPLEAHRQLLQAWFLGDGHRRTRGWVGTTTSYDLACQMQMLLVRCGIHCRFECLLDGHVVEVQEAVNGGVSVRGSNGKLASFSLCVPDSQVSGLGFDRQGSHQQHLRNLEGFVIVPITGIDESRHEGWVYDLEVEEDHSYVVEGIAVHNCQVRFTICSKCGNVAIDETQLCPHIKYGKGNTFQDALGQTRKTAELCGHITAEPGSVKFVEASWVANPAFTGAVLRNILTPQEAQAYENRVQVAFSQPARKIDPNLMQKAAFNFGDEEEAFEGEGDKEKDKGDKSPLDDLVDEVADKIRDLAKKKVKQDLGVGGLADLPADTDENLNDTMIKEAALRDLLVRQPVWRKVATLILARVKDPATARKILRGLVLYKRSGWAAVGAVGGFTGREVLAISQFADQLNRQESMAGENRIYRTVLAVGGMAPYEDVDSYLAACRRILNRDLTGAERAALVSKGKLYGLGS